MTTELRVVDQGRGRARIVGATSGSAEATALEAWLGERIDVAAFERRASTDALYVDYDDGAALPGRFLRSLRDKAHTLNRSGAGAASFDVEPVHSLQGRVRLRVSGIEERQLETLTMITAGMPGVKRTHHVPGSSNMLVLYDPAELSESRIVDELRKSDPIEWAREWHRPTPMRWIAALNGTSVLIMCLIRGAPLPWLAAGVVMSTLRPLGRSLAALREGTFSVDLLDVAATLAALATGRPTTAAFVIWMVGVGDLLLDVSANQARSALSTLMKRRDRDALRVLPGGEIETVPVRALRVGDRFVVHSGHSVVADGRVVSGAAELDEKTLNGESRLRSKRPGDPVFASTLVVEGSLVAEVERSGGNTEVAKIESILNTVGSKPLTLQRDALDFASKLVLPTFGVAALAAALSGDVTRAVCVLITDFGTGIRIAVPTSAMTGMGLAAREGVLVKGAQFLERLAKTDILVFDKTGTLTTGVPEVVEVITGHGTTEASVIRACASAEATHDHPVAKALKAYAKARGIDLVAPDAGAEQYVVGLGLSASVQGHRVRVGRASWMESSNLELSHSFKRHLARFEKACVSNLCVAVDDEVVGLIAYSDATRPESAAAIRALRDNGRRKVVLLSGDSAEVAKSVADSLGIDEALGGLLPEEKAAFVTRLRMAGHVVAMVGDGINDAPAMAAADVGISMAGGTDVALETADVVLLDGGLSRLEAAFRIGDRAMSSVRQNLGVIIAPNAIAIALGALGYIRPELAAIINNGATILAVMTGTLPLLKAKKHPAAPESEIEPKATVVRLPTAGHRRRVVTPPRPVVVASRKRG